MKSKFVYIYSILTLLVISSFVFVIVYSDSSMKPNVSLSGSSLLNTYLNPNSTAQDKQQIFFKNFVINTQEKSTTDTLKSVIDNEVGIGVLDRELSAHEATMLKQNEIRTITYAQTPYAVITNKHNKMENITTQNIKKLVNNVKTNWNEIDKQKQTGSVKLILPSINLEYLNDFWKKLITNDQQNLNYRLDKLTLKQLLIKTMSSKYNTYAKIIKAVEDDEDAIAIVPYSLIMDNSLISISKINNEQINQNNLLSEKYSFNLKLSIIFRDNNETLQRQHAKEVVDTLTMEDFKKWISVPGKVNSLVPVK